ncbi:Bug family tripartite tricarboxylate transporter substrate binding protein [Aquabacterium sp. OR-4]|uniref:Bug family tripartite tricarboxylate transporter substrate binding protein n=1 Tax=Aquabacterium sp. OR-4 TaxID=2978127 RepID=UPI0028C7235D|nr:tripartite tricarboxylate transporter substrate binding protein [Aquabacterium sp. OR-4]MDT7833853.1 tripartite tricarboxylate transporter substrate binding protein [Aquabacterium sp. OR-4]
MTRRPHPTLRPDPQLDPQLDQSPDRPDPQRRALLGQAGASALLAATGSARAAERFPERPMTLLVPFAPGGIADITARAVGEAMARRLGQPVVVDNRPSAGSIVASQAVATARPDGHTLLLMSNGHAVSVGLFRKLPYDTRRDFAPISTLGFFDIGVFTGAGSRLQSLKDLLAAARAQPGRLNVGTIAVGSTQHLAAKLFETVAGIDLTVVPYKASPAVVNALRSGEIDVAFEILGPMVAQVQAGAVRVLAVSSDRRNPALPDAPTVAEAGVAGYNVASWNALAAPAGTPPEVIATLNQAVREALGQAAVQERLAKLGMRPAASAPADMARLLDGEIRRWGEVIRTARIEPE